MNLQEIFSIKNIIIYLIVINLIAFLSMFIDKKQNGEDGGFQKILYFYMQF